MHRKRFRLPDFALNWGNPRKIPEKSGKSQKRQKGREGRTSPDREALPFEPPLSTSPNQYPKDPAVLKTVRDSELLRRSVFYYPPQIYYAVNPLFDGTNAYNSQENGVGTRCAAIVNHYAIVNLLRRANLLRRSIFSTAGSFG